MATVSALERELKQSLKGTLDLLPKTQKNMVAALRYRDTPITDVLNDAIDDLTTYHERITHAKETAKDLCDRHRWEIEQLHRVCDQEQRQACGQLNKELTSLRQEHEDLSRAHTTVRNEFHDERLRARNLFTRNQSLQNEIKGLHDEKARMVNEYNQLLNQYQKLDEIHSDNVRKANRPIGERVAADALDKAVRAFAVQDYHKARVLHQQVKHHLTGVPEEYRREYETDEIDYQVAICDAYVNEIDSSEQVLVTFIDSQMATFAEYRRRAPESKVQEKMLRVAHAQHLLAQIHIGKNRLDLARQSADQAEQTRLSLSHRDDDLRQESLILQYCIAVLERDESRMPYLTVEVRDGRRETCLRQYKKLSPLQRSSTTPKGMEGFRPSQDAPQLLPIWLMRHAAPEPHAPHGAPQMSPTQPNTNGLRGGDDARHSTSDLGTRKSLIKMFGLSTRYLDENLKDAILRSKMDALNRIPRRTRGQNPALHLAALCGDVDIAAAILEADASVNGVCDCDVDGHNFPGVRPMHFAVATRNKAMVSLLVRHGASFERPDIGTKHTTAPVYWLLCDRWFCQVDGANPAMLIDMLQHMKSKGWNAKAPIQVDGKNLKKAVPKLLADWPELKTEVEAWLEGQTVSRDSGVGLWD